MNVKTSDPEISAIITNEAKRQSDTLALIPSENYASLAVRHAVGSVLMNKYAEGQPHKRYYQGNENVDQLEDLCKVRALEAFSLKPEEWGVNVQPHSGCPANLAVYNAVLQPGDRIFAMYLPDGGHLSHGWHLEDKKFTLVSKIWDVSFYHVDQNTKLFDYDGIAIQAKKIKPKLIISGGTAYPREINHKRMGEIARAVGAYYLADISHEAGLVAAGVNDSPFPHAHFVTMTTHKTLRGPRGAMIFARTDHIDSVNTSVFPGLQGGPHMHTIAGIAVALKEAQSAAFKKYARQIVTNAAVLAREFMKKGYDVVSGGTDKHLVLLDLRSKNISAWVAAWALEYANIIANRNTVPYDTGSSYYPSGLRMGTPAVTTRGMMEKEMVIIAGYIDEILTAVKPFTVPEDKAERQKYLKTIHAKLKILPQVVKIGREVKQLVSKFPLPA